MMVILGCNVYVSGMVGVNVAILAKMINKEKSDLSDMFTKELLLASMHRQLMEKNGLSSEAVDTYINAILYKPTNIVPTIDNGNNNVISK
jgi:hypothetical protein